MAAANVNEARGKIFLFSAFAHHPYRGYTDRNGGKGKGGKLFPRVSPEVVRFVSRESGKLRKLSGLKRNGRGKKNEEEKKLFEWMIPNR